MRQKDIDNLKKIVEFAPHIDSMYLLGQLDNLETNPILVIVADTVKDFNPDEDYLCRELLCKEYKMYSYSQDEISLRVYYKDDWVPDYLKEDRYKLMYERGVWYI